MFRKTDIVSIIILALGLILLITYVILEIYELNYDFQYWIIGVCCIVLSLIICILSGIAKIDKSKTTISSFGTPLYKVIILPLLIIIDLFILAGLIAIFKNNIDKALLVFLLGIFIYLLFTTYKMIGIVTKMKWVEYDKENLYVSGLRDKITIHITEIRDFKRIDYGAFYSLDFSNHKKIIILPKLIEIFDSLGGEPKSIKMLKKLTGFEKTDAFTNLQDRMIKKLFNK